MYDDGFGQDQEPIQSFRLNTCGTISDDFKTRVVRITDVSRVGIGFEIDDFAIKMNEVYETTIFCDDESVRLQLIVRYAHIMEKTIRYGCDIHRIAKNDLNKLYYDAAV
ncbi:PilZ domain-containing protein [Paenibacillus xerothermodurans]|uniref:PilZ domain-containing protein n=1 Tax=Paenibacillus xerothermodurans TaxID=1977292 RepID=A0A2W1N9V1_PAEXE|nr:PilZ domain-containing protein [Paenibacillus xerothermodurans]PZE21429.1 PilZ domain-containing protein [Paenibacillus xerothermodurans]